MSLNIRNLGWWRADNEFTGHAQKLVLPTSVGTTIVLIPDSNAPEAFAANNIYGDGTDTDLIRVFEVNSDFTTSTQVATISPGALRWPAERVSADLYSDNSIGLAYQLATGAIQYRKITYGTWAISAAEAVNTPGGDALVLDVSISDANVPAVGFVEENTANPKCVCDIFIKRTSDGVWVNSVSQNITTTNDPNRWMTTISIQWIKGGTAAERGFAFAVASAVQAGADHGTRIWQGVVAESTGVMSNLTLRSTLLAGNMTTTWGTFVRRAYLFSTAVNELTAAVMEAVDKKNMLVTQFTWSGSTWTQTLVPQTSVAGNDKISRLYRFAATYAKDVVTFYYMSEYGGVYTPYNYIAAIDRTAKSVRYSGPFKFDNAENTAHNRFFPMGGTGRNADRTDIKHGILFFGQNNQSVWYARVHNAKSAPAPSSVTPAAGASIASGTPELSLRASLGKRFPQSKHKAVWQIASDIGFTTAVRTYTQPDSKFITISNTDGTNYVYIADTLPDSLVLTSGTWYLRAALVDEFKITGTWSAAQSFSLAHPPVAANLSPSAGQVLADGNILFDWDFTDPSPTDSQTALQVIVERNDNGIVILDTGKITSTVTSHLGNISNTYAGVLLRWKVRLWDTDDTAGSYSEYETFMVSAPATVVIDAPTEGAAVASGTPIIRFTPTVGGGRTIKKFHVLIAQAGTVVRDSGQVSVDVASGVQLTWRSPMPLLANNTSHTVQVQVTDNTGMTGTSAVRTFSTAMVAPASSSGLTADSSGYNLEGSGYISVSWNDTNRDLNFEAWVVSRKSDLIGLDNAVVKEGTWTEIAQVKQTAASYTYKDYYAPSGYRVQYKVQQLVDRSGDRAISENDAVVSTFPQSEGYWIIQPVDAAGVISAFRLHNVTSDDYTEEVEESEYVIIGRGRHVDQGDVLGPKGSLSAQLRDGYGTNARQKKLQLESARKLGIAVYLRNPFGDVWLVSIGNIDISRIAGVGKAEFVDVTVPYSEVVPK